MADYHDPPCEIKGCDRKADRSMPVRLVLTNVCEECSTDMQWIEHHECPETIEILVDTIPGTFCSRQARIKVCERCREIYQPSAETATRFNANTTDGRSVPS